MTDSELTISAFAAASRLSHKALRLYAELGLLPPARVDPQSGYRYYSPAQLPEAQLIGLLRRLDLPLADIRRLLDAPLGERPAVLRALWGSAKAEQQRREDLARYLLHKLQGENDMSDAFQVGSRHVPAQQLACISQRVTVQDLPRTIQQGIRDLHDTITAQGASFAGAPIVIYHGEVNADSDGPIEVCWPYSGTLKPTGAVILREEPAHHEAFVVLNKAQFEFPRILSAYDATADYAGAHGTSGPLACREVYPYDWDAAGEGDPVGEVAWPYTPKEG